jgi:predicted Rdx family selenoprotein
MMMACKLNEKETAYLKAAKLRKKTGGRYKVSCDGKKFVVIKLWRKRKRK